MINYVPPKTLKLAPWRSREDEEKIRFWLGEKIWKQYIRKEIYKESSKLSSTNHIVSRWAKDMSGHFTEEEHRWQRSTHHYVQHHWPLGKWQWGPRWDVPAHLPERLEWKRSDGARCWAERELRDREHWRYWWEHKRIQSPWKTVWEFLKTVNLQPS